MGLSETDSDDTTIEQTKHKKTAIIKVFAKLSFSTLATGESPLDVGLHHKVIEQWGEQVAEQNR